MRAVVLSGLTGDAWKMGPRSAAELKEAAAHFGQAAMLCAILQRKITNTPALRDDAAAWERPYKARDDQATP